MTANNDTNFDQLVYEGVNVPDESAQTIDDLVKITYLEDKNVVFFRSEGGFLSLKLNKDGKDEIYNRVTLQRVFPLSKQFEFVAVKKVGENRQTDEEIGLIKDIREFTEENKKHIYDELKLRYFAPEILKILSRKDEFGSLYMEIITNAGKKNVVIQNNGSGFVRISPIRFIMIDVDGNRYEIIDINKLDKRSLRLLEVAI